MEHLDEGEIHAWIDGEASAARGAEIELHAASCAECAARIAEARGFVAASSRILSALDDVPGDVIPAIPQMRPDDLAVRRQTAAKRRRFAIPMSAAAAVLVAVLGTFTWSSVGRERATETFAIQGADKEQATVNREQPTLTAADPTAAPVAAPIAPPRPSAPTVASAAPARDNAVAQSAAPKESRAELASIPPGAMAADEEGRFRRDRAGAMAAAPMPSAAAPTASPMAGAAAAAAEGARGSVMGRREAAKSAMADSAAERPAAMNDEATIAGCYRIDGSNPPRFLELRSAVLPEERDPAAHLLLLRGGAAVERAAWAFSGRDSVRLELGQTSMATTVRARAGRGALSGATANGQPFRAVRSASCS